MHRALLVSCFRYSFLNFPLLESILIVISCNSYRLASPCCNRSNLVARTFRNLQIPIVFSSPPNNFSLHAAMNVTRFNCVLKHGRANALTFLLFFFFLSKLHADRYEATTEVASRQWPWESAWANRDAQHFSPHSSIIHLHPSPSVLSSSISPSTFVSTCDPCSFIRIPSGSPRTIRRLLRLARYIRDSTCTLISNRDAYPHSCVTRRHIRIRASVHCTHRPVGEHRTWARHYRECNIKLK